MPKISDKVAEWKRQRPDEPFFSFEYFPPKTEAGVNNLIARVEKMGAMRPMWIDFTWGAGGSTADTTLNLCETAMDVTGLDVLMHLTCTNVTVDETREVLQRCKDKGLCNILALRGDPPKNQEAWTATEGGFSYAVDLVRFIRKEFGDYFCIGVAAYPEGHTDCESFEKDMGYFKDKVDAGADFAVTQLFYDVTKFTSFVKKSREMGIPESFDIYPGIMPIQNYGGFKRMTGFCKTFIPDELEKGLEPIQNDDAAVKKFGIEHGVQMGRELIESGCPGVHLYTLNLETSCTEIVKGLGLLRSPSPKEYPWNKSTGTRSTETTRPIFWAQRSASYVKRTSTWDDFPNGRFGSRDSPAYGLFALPPKPTEKQQEELAKQWDFSDESGLRDVFVEFLTQGSKVTSLPWCPEEAGDETVCIRPQLQKLCRSGFLTINSQPRVNGALSTDPLFGWGPAGGVVYQKAYAEFFCSPANFEALEKELAGNSQIDMMAVTRSGDMKGCSSSPVTAVTWGVFPGQEIQQPTVVDANSFIAWKDEAFALFDQFLQVLPEDKKSARAFVEEVQNTWYLVNCVDNNFLSGDLYSTLGNVAHKQPLVSMQKGA
jgi:methylenetetrahydrofolate reductase (NADPH)